MGVVDWWCLKGWEEHSGDVGREGGIIKILDFTIDTI